ncbi:MAG: glutamate--tRNA ligase [Thermodesulfobacteriota bacterium]|nr:MAG: glutamate--tRNA ligase [Thermodesulfobacteriota bacterium]
MVRTRFAPSPTGALHLGNARTALFNWLFARRHKGSFILRIEDTDTKRSTYEAEKGIYEDLKWLGLNWDEGPDAGGPFGPYRQSERLSIYKDEAERLVDEGKAYRCYCTVERLEELRAEQAAKGLPSRYDGRCRELDPRKAPEGAPSVIRFKVPVKDVMLMDAVHGLLSFDSRAIGDFVIMGSDGIAAYNFAAVVDDSGMSISHVIRGDDHLSNTPRQILLFESLGRRAPIYSHVPLVLGPDRTPLSKRHGDFSLKGLREEGYLPEAIANAIARLGWSPGEGLFTLEEMAGRFTLERLSKSGSEFDIARLKSYSKVALARRSGEGLASLVGIEGADTNKLVELSDALKKNASTINELRALMRPFLSEPAPGEAALSELKEERSRRVITAFKEELEKITGPEDYEAIIERVKAATGEKGRHLLMPARLALTGEREGIELPGVFRLLGKREAIRRLEKWLR